MVELNTQHERTDKGLASNSDSTLVPMLIGGLVLIVIAMVAVLMFA